MFESKGGLFRTTIFNNKKMQVSYNEMNSEDNSESNSESNIVSVCKEPKSREDLAKLLKGSSVLYIMNKYIQLLMDSGKITMTMPKKPKSKNQRYCSKRCT